MDTLSKVEKTCFFLSIVLMSYTYPQPNLIRILVKVQCALEAVSRLT